MTKIIMTTKKLDSKNEKPEKTKPETVPEKGGRAGPEPTRYGDWEKNGRCIDF